jgi:hypothetical protein
MGEDVEGEIRKLRDEFGNLPVEVSVDESDETRIVVRLKRRVGAEAFQRYVATCKRLGLKFDRERKCWWKRVGAGQER